MKRAILGLAVLALVGCGGPGPLRVELPADRSDPSWLADPDLVERTLKAANASARAWGGSPGDLDGWTIRYEPHPIVIGGPPLAGRADGYIMRVWAGAMGGRCVETSALPHEIGHAIIGDSEHRDARWRDPAFWQRMAEALVVGVPTYDVGCRELVEDAYATWRH